MKFSGFFLFVCATVLALQGCKKEESDTKLYLDGTLEVAGSMPKYVNAGKTYDFVPSGLSASDSSHIAYYFTDSYSSTKDTIMAEGHPATKYTYTVPDTLASITLTCVGYAEGSSAYYTSSTTFDYVIVDPNLNSGTITGFPYYPDDIISSLHGHEYFSTKIGGKLWMRQNLGYIVGEESKGWSFGHPYYESDAMRPIFGSYYTLEEAKTACPEGWELPSDKDFAELLKAGGVTCSMEVHKDFDHGAGALMEWVYFNGEKMWEYYRGVDVTNSTKFTALPVGYALVNDGVYTYEGYGEYAVFWTSDTVDGMGVYRYIHMQEDNVFAGCASDTGFAASVRCVRSY